MRDLSITVSELTRIFTQVLILAGCIYYISKHSTLEGFLLLAGSVIGIISNLYFVFFMSTIDYNDQSLLINIFSTLTSIGSLSFAIGFFILIHKLVVNKDNE